jgi:hypothetical protein
VNALGAPYVLEGLFGEADAESDSEPAADAMGIDLEDDAEGAAATVEQDGGMIVDDGGAANNTDTLCVNLPAS